MLLAPGGPAICRRRRPRAKDPRGPGVRADPGHHRPALGPGRARPGRARDAVRAAFLPPCRKDPVNCIAIAGRVEPVRQGRRRGLSSRFRHAWHASRQEGATVYAHRNVSKSPRAVESMQRMVMGVAGKPSLAGHRSHRRRRPELQLQANLRITSKSGNALNQRRNRNVANAGVREVLPGRWAARAVIDGKYRHIGTFDSTGRH